MLDGEHHSLLVDTDNRALVSPSSIPDLGTESLRSLGHTLPAVISSSSWGAGRDSNKRTEYWKVGRKRHCHLACEVERAKESGPERSTQKEMPRKDSN